MQLFIDNQKIIRNWFGIKLFLYLELHYCLRIDIKQPNAIMRRLFPSSVLADCWKCIMRQIGAY